MIDFGAVLGALVRGNVEFIIVGGAAATIHGSARLTSDLDIVYRRSAENIRRLAVALADHRPYLRGAPAGLPFRFDEKTLNRRVSGARSGVQAPGLFVSRAPRRFILLA